jgi:hypothetical protein
VTKKNYFTTSRCVLVGVPVAIEVPRSPLHRRRIHILGIVRIQVGMHQIQLVKVVDELVVAEIEHAVRLIVDPEPSDELGAEEGPGARAFLVLAVPFRFLTPRVLELEQFHRVRVSHHGGVGLVVASRFRDQRVVFVIVPLDYLECLNYTVGMICNKKTR